MTGVSGIEPLPERAPEKGELVKVRSRTWLVDDVRPPAIAGQSSLVSLSCADDVSTFSGTHFVTPRAYQVHLGVTF